MTLEELVKDLPVEIIGDKSVEIIKVSTVQNSMRGSISFLANPLYKKFLQDTQASAVILTEEEAADCPVTAVVCENPYLIYAEVASRLYPQPEYVPGVDSTALVHTTATYDDTVHIGPNVVIGPGVVIGSHSVIEAGCVLSHRIQLGEKCHLYPNVSIREDVRLGDRVILHPGVVLGADGFGIANHQGQWLKVPQIGGVLIGDDVEIGSNSTIDRGAVEDTIIENGVKIDNLVQIGHNCVVGEGTAIAGCAGISGSARIGKRCMIGGAVGMAGHITIADDVILTGFTMVTKSIKEAGIYSSGIPVKDNARWRKDVARFNRLDSLVQRVTELENAIKK